MGVKMFHPELDDEHVIEILPEQVVPHESVGWQVIEDDDAVEADAEQDDEVAGDPEPGGDTPAVVAAESRASTPASGGRRGGKGSRRTPATPPPAPPVEGAGDPTSSNDQGV